MICKNYFLICLGYKVKVKRPVWFRGKGKVFFTPNLFTFTQTGFLTFTISVIQLYI